MIDLRKQKHLPAIWQVYQQLFYESRIKAAVNATYEKYLKAEGQGQDTATLKKERLLILNWVVREMYNAETEEVKAQVEKRREELRKQGNEGVYDDPEKLQK